MLLSEGATGPVAVPATTRGPPGSKDSNPRPNAFRLSGAVVFSVSIAFSAAVVIRPLLAQRRRPAGTPFDTSTFINLIHR